MTHTKTIQDLAQEVLNNMETKKRNDGKQFVALKSHDIQWHVDLCCEAHDDVLPNDFVYEQIENALYLIKDAEGEDKDEIQENILDSNSIEPDPYNSDLLAWVSSNLGFSEYVDRAMQNYQTKDFF